MLSGVNILETAIEPSVSPLAVVASAAITILILIAAIVNLIGVINCDEKSLTSKVTITVMNLSALFLFLALTINLFTLYKVPVTTYKVEVDESVHLVDFYERYDVLSESEGVYTVREKDK
jgi:fumarate reductase subunit D